MRHLPSRDFVPYAPKNTGVEINVDHTNCPDGEDTRGRLYIKRLPSNRIVAFCHNCGLGGSARAGVRPIHQRHEKFSEKSSGEGIYLPPDLETNVALWPSHAVSWPLRYGITRADLEQYRFGYSPRLDRVVIPVYNSSWELLGYQSRRLSEWDTLPKYLSRAPKGESKSLVFRACEGEAAKVCVVEDALSCIKVNKLDGIHGIACLGTNLSRTQLLLLSKQYSSIVIFLDNDNTQVKRQQRKLYQQCSLLFKSVKVVRSDRDPKEHSIAELEELLYA